MDGDYFFILEMCQRKELNNCDYCNDSPQILQNLAS